MISATLGRPPAAGFTAGFAGAAAGASAAAGSAGGGADSDFGAGEASADFPSAARAAARISATDIFFLSAMNGLSAALTARRGTNPYGRSRNRSKSMFRPRLREFVKFFTNSF
jgi:hypothetical protein